MLKFFGYQKCGTCRKAIKWLSTNDIPYQFIDITENPPSQTVLTKIVKSGEYQVKDLFNRSGKLYRDFNLKDKLPTMTTSAAIALLAQHGKLCKRPLVTDGKRFSVGFQAQDFAAKWS